MLPLIVDGFVDKSGNPKDSRVMPRVYQQVDWSNGGDGIVVRESIKTVADLRGKTIAMAENSPSHYFLLNMLVAAEGVETAGQFELVCQAGCDRAQGHLFGEPLTAAEIEDLLRKDQAATHSL